MASAKLLKSIFGHKEWLLSDGQGGYAFGCCDAKQRRRYHSLLTVSALAPIRRILMLGFVEEHLAANGRKVPLFEDLDPTCAFEAEGSQCVRWHQTVTLGKRNIRVSRELTLLPEGGSRLVYRFDGSLPPGATLLLRPILYQRCHHRTLGLDGMQHHVEVPTASAAGNWTLKTTLLNFEKIQFTIMGGDSLVLTNGKKFLVNYPTEAERGFEHQEEVESDFEFAVTLSPDREKNPAVVLDTSTVAQKRETHSSRPLFLPNRNAPCPSDKDKDLWNWMLDMAEASNNFLARGNTHDAILAGYPWFGVWARDTFQSLNSFCLLTKRHAQARSILDFFSGYIEKGLVPNRFYMAPDRMIFARDYGSADATPWFLYAAAQYGERSHDREFLHNYLEKVEDIVDWHERGTSWNICVDPADGLVYGGAHGVPLTWMHARVGDRCFTPRIGKPIEVNAVWIASLRKWAILARQAHRPTIAERFEAFAQKANVGFERFWNDHYGWFADVLDTPTHDGYRPDLSLRPNQVLALALPGVQIEASRRARALTAIRENLLTPVGLRGLSPRDPRYRPVYKGSSEERDLAYHNGPAWPWLLGFYISAQHLAHGDAARNHVRDVLSGLRPFYGRDCLNHLAELYDAEYPFPSRGCSAQAVSLALVLQALAEVHFGLSELPH